MQLHQIDGVWFDMTPHAKQRAVDMALEPEQIRDVLTRPRQRLRAAEMKEKWTRGNLTAVIHPRDGYYTVVTFIWATMSAWRDDRERLHSRDVEFTAQRTRDFRAAKKYQKRHHGRKK